MPYIYLTQAEQQRLQAILKEDLSELNCRSENHREMVRTIAENAAHLKWNTTMKRNLQQHRHREISKIAKQIGKRIVLLKKIKHPEQTAL